MKLAGIVIAVESKDSFAIFPYNYLKHGGYGFYWQGIVVKQDGKLSLVVDINKIMELAKSGEVQGLTFEIETQEISYQSKLPIFEIELTNSDTLAKDVSIRDLLEGSMEDGSSVYISPNKYRYSYSEKEIQVLFHTDLFQKIIPTEFTVGRPLPPPPIKIYNDISNVEFYLANVSNLLKDVNMENSDIVIDFSLWGFSQVNNYRCMFSNYCANGDSAVNLKGKSFGTNCGKNVYYTRMFSHCRVNMLDLSDTKFNVDSYYFTEMFKGCQIGCLDLRGSNLLDIILGLNLTSCTEDEHEEEVVEPEEQVDDNMQSELKVIFGDDYSEYEYKDYDDDDDYYYEDEDECIAIERTNGMKIVKKSFSKANIKKILLDENQMANEIIVEWYNRILEYSDVCETVEQVRSLKNGVDDLQLLDC